MGPSADAERPAAPIRVLVADDHRLVREGTAALLALESSIEVVALAADGREAIEAALRVRPDVALIDLNMPHVSGREACAFISNRLPATRVLLLTVSEQDRDLYAALRVGAAGYLLKDMPPADLIEAVIKVVRGDQAIAPAMAARMLGDLVSDPDTSGVPHREAEAVKLSPRERDVLALLADGLTNREIAARLSISQATVKTHVGHLLTKLHLRNRSEAAALVARTWPSRLPADHP
ncbi:MAG TPA: response regulator transcription factor [Candidatus Limnocylindrales bacterium]|nr:response regulator transcription factor [Candidatus Limnocylindrales bacterium]